MSAPTTNQVRESFVTVQITVLSIIVALGLENLTGALADAPTVEGWWLASRWLQVLLFATVLIVMWGGFSLTAATTRRPPSLLDLIAPFALLGCMNWAAWGIQSVALHQVLMAIGVSSSLSALMIYADYRHDRMSLDRPALLQVAIAVLAAIGAFVVLQVPEPTWHCVIVVGLTLLQGYGLIGVIDGWQTLSSLEDPTAT